MGAYSYFYFTKYYIDLEKTLEVLRQQEFIAGRYNPVVPFLDFPITEKSPSPGANHSSIEEALEAAGMEGTRSVLDISEIATVTYEKASNSVEEAKIYNTSFSLSNNELVKLFGTEKPTHEKVKKVIVLENENEDNANEFWENIERGTSRHIVIYDSDEPIEVFFVGYSFD